MWEVLISDYKIAAKAITNRFKQVLLNLIDNDQTGFLKGRFIGENIRLIDNIIKYTAAKKYPRPFTFSWLEKTFNTVEKCNMLAISKMAAEKLIGVYRII